VAGLHLGALREENSLSGRCWPVASGTVTRYRCALRAAAWASGMGILPALPAKWLAGMGGGGEAICAGTWRRHQHIR